LYAYDGFGNRTSVTVTKGTAPSGNLTYDGMTNRITNSGFSYDANGNLTAMPGLNLYYDVGNRLVQAGGQLYGYAPDNQRIWQYRGVDYGTEVYFYGVDGRRLGLYRTMESGSPAILCENVYFAGRLISRPGGLLAQDRLGSVRARRAAGLDRLNYFPWGEEQVTTTQNRDRFATYYRDSTGLDYAQNRHYSSQHGRFLTPDPYRASAALSNPQSWNRYAYVENDPVNFADPRGLYRSMADSVTRYYDANEMWAQEVAYWSSVWSGGGGGGGGGGGDTGGRGGASTGDEATESPEERARGFLPDAVARATKAFESSDCRGLFGEGLDPRDVLDNMVTGVRYGSIGFQKLEPGVDGTVVPDQGTAQDVGGETKYLRVDIVINSRQDGSKYWSGSDMTAEERARYLIHELGHAYNYLLGSGGSQFGQDVDSSGKPILEAQERNKQLEKKCVP
jgi:RHS repeat-associated protein